jgi:hypothetical protein
MAEQVGGRRAGLYGLGARAQNLMSLASWPGLFRPSTSLSA